MKNQRFPVQDLINHVTKATSYNADQTPIGGVMLKTGDQNGQFIFELKISEIRDWELYRAEHSEHKDIPDSLNYGRMENFLKRPGTNLLVSKTQSPHTKITSINSKAVADNFLK